MGGLSAPEETSKSQFECSEGRGSGAASNSQSRQASGACGHSVWRRLCSNRLLIIALMLIWILLAVFIVLFIISPREHQNACQAEVYSGTVCRNTLTTVSLSCGIIEAANLYISTQGGDQADIETQVLTFFDELQLTPSLECEEVVLSFLCLFAFPLCVSGELYLPSSGECETLTTEICAQEWQIAVSVFGSENLPHCDNLPVTSWQCNGSSTEIVCSTDFYLDVEDNTCKAECGKWKLYSDTLETVMITLIVVATAVGIIGGAVVLILSCINYNKAFAFPSAILRYEVAIVMVYNVVVLISLIGGRSLFCSSRNLFVMESTQYCTFTAVFFYYTYNQLTILWVLHTAAIFWGLMFPFQAHRFDVTGKYKYLHLAVILLAIFIPGINVAVALSPEGVEFARIPPIICSASSRNGNFYGLFLPITIIDAIGTSLLVLIFWMIHKNSQITAATAQPILRTPEAKILFINCYFLGFGIYAFIIICASFWETIADQYLNEYLLCESIGVRPGNSCTDERTFAVVLQIVFDISSIALGSFPAVNLIYAVNISDLKQKCKKRFPSWFAATPANSTVKTG